MSDAAQHRSGVAVKHAQPEFLGTIVAEEIVGAVFSGEALGHTFRTSKTEIIFYM